MSWNLRGTGVRYKKVALRGHLGIQLRQAATSRRPCSRPYAYLGALPFVPEISDAFMQRNG